MSKWSIIKDVLLTLGGLALIGQQALAIKPNNLLLVAGLALTGIGASFHVSQLVGGFIGSSSSASIAEDSELESGHSSGSKGGHH